MTEEATDRPLRPHARVRAGMRRPHNWIQLLKFCAVGGSGYVVNLCVFALCVEVFDLHHLIAATAAFAVAVTNNFWWNRHWTFRAGAGRAGFQAPRFLAVSVLAFVVAACVLQLLVSLGVPELPAQALSIALATPLNFVGNKIWSFAVPLGLLALVLLAGAAPALANDDLRQPDSQTVPPKGYERSAREVIAAARTADAVREERANGRMAPTAYTNGPGRWQVSFFRDDDEVVQVQVDDASRAVLEDWRGDQVAWTMARGYEGAFGRKLNAPYVWIPLCLLFLVPFVDVRRPFRLLHLDLLVLLGFGVSHYFFNRGEIGVSVPLVYPVLLYLLVRVMFAALRPRERPGRLVPHLPLDLMVMGVAFLLAFRIGLNVADSNVIDVGYAGVIGADRIADGESLYGPGFAPDVERGDTYGPLNYLSYVPFEQAMPWSGTWDDLPAAHGAAVAFDLLVLAGLALLGTRLRRGREGAFLGAGLAWAWVTYPYAAFALQTNSNDALVAVAAVGAMLALTLKGTAANAIGRGAAVAVGAAAKFAPLILAPAFARGVRPDDASGAEDGPPRGGGVRGFLIYALALAAVLAVAFLPFMPEGGLRELYDRTVGYQAGRPSPFSIWGQVPSLDWLQTGVKAAALLLAAAVAFVPRTRDARQVAALAAAVLIALQLTVTHWFYLYVVWFAPFVLVAVMGAYRERVTTPEPAAAGSTSPARPDLLPPVPH